VKRPGLNILFGAACILLAASLSARNPGPLFVSTADISFRIFSDQKSYENDDEIQLNYRITNTSNEPLYVPREWEVACPRVPHIWAWFEDHSGNHLMPSFTGDCVPTKQTFQERMSKEAVLLKPGESTYGPLKLDPKVFHLAAGRYRVEASLTGWHEERFTPEERAELEKMGHPFVTGEAPDSLTIILTGDLPDHPVDRRM